MTCQKGKLYKTQKGPGKTLWAEPLTNKEYRIQNLGTLPGESIVIYVEAIIIRKNTLAIDSPIWHCWYRVIYQGKIGWIFFVDWDLKVYVDWDWDIGKYLTEFSS